MLRPTFRKSARSTLAAVLGAACLTAFAIEGCFPQSSETQSSSRPFSRLICFCRKSGASVCSPNLIRGFYFHGRVPRESGYLPLLVQRHSKWRGGRFGDKNGLPTRP